jgi:hypothetical protein
MMPLTCKIQFILLETFSNKKNVGRIGQKNVGDRLSRVGMGMAVRTDATRQTFGLENRKKM